MTVLKSSFTRWTTAAVLLLSLLLAGCAPTRLGVGWAGIRTIGEEQNILVAYNDFIVLVDPSTGDEVQLLNEEGRPRIDPESNQPRLWQITGQQGAQYFSVPLQLDDETLLAADYNRKLLKVDVQNALIESPTGTATGGQVVADLVSDGERIYLPYYNYNLAAVDADTLDQVWEFKTDNGIWSKPLVNEDVLYFGSMNHWLYAVNAENGEERWQLNLEGALAGSPVLYNDKLYIGSFARKIFEVSLDGEILNTYTTENWIWGSPVVQDGVLYAADMSGFVYALSLEDGFNEVWKTKATGRGIRPSPLVTEDYVVVAGRDGNVDWLDTEDGGLLYQRQVQSEVLSDILLIQPSDALDIAQPLVVIGTVNSSQLLHAFTLEGAEPSWVYTR